MASRIEPAPQPYDDDMEASLARLMPPGVEPLTLFRTLARNPRVFRRFMAGGLLDKGSLSLRDRELVIVRTCARCRAEYEWGIHVAFFGAKIRLDEAQVRATLDDVGGAVAACWSAREQLILKLVDALHDTRAVPDALWADLKGTFADDQLLELMVLCGLYGMVSMLVNGLRLEPEPFAARFV